MLKKAHQIKAGLIKEVAKSSGKAIAVVATLSDLDFKPANVALATYSCKHCRTQFASADNYEPNCVCCGSDEIVEEIDETVVPEDLSTLPEDELASVPCSHCNTYNVMSMATAKVLDSSFNCVTCSTKINYSLAADDSAFEDDFSDTGETEVSESDSEDDVSIDVTELDSVDLLDTDEETADLNDNDHTGSRCKPTDVEVNQQIDTNGIQLPSEQVNLHETLSGEFSVELHGDKLVASVGPVPVAYLLKEKASPEHAKYFHNRSLANAIETTAYKTGLQKTFAAFKFDVIAVALPVNETVSKQVKAEVAKVEADFNDRKAELASDYKQCLSIAAVGLNRNFFKSASNDLKKSLIENCSAAGVRNADKIITACFKNHAESYVKTLLETANTLLAKSVDHRNEIAETLGETDYVEEVSEEISEGDDDTLEARLETATLRKQKVTASAAKNQDSNLVLANLRQNIEMIKRTNPTGNLF